MGRVLIEQRIRFGIKTLSHKCKSKERAAEIVAKLPNVVNWNYYGFNDRIPKQKKKVKPEPTINDMMVMAGLLTAQEAKELNQ